MKKHYKLLILLFLTALFTAKTYAGTYGGGDGSPENPFLISTAEHLQELSTTRADWNQVYYFLLTADIDMTEKVFNPIGYKDNAGVENIFNGTIDGDGHVITNITITGWSDHWLTNGTLYLSVGLIGLGEGCTIKNLGIENGLIDLYQATRNAGLIAGNLRASIVDNCFSTGIINGENKGASIVGLAETTTQVTNCWGNVAINTYFAKSGGIIGEISGVSATVNVCAFYGSVSQAGVPGTSSGAIVGNLKSATADQVSNSYFIDTVADANSTGTALSIEELKLQTSYAGFDFTNIWRMAYGGYAVLRAFNKAPVADAGSNQNITEGALVSLNGELSNDADGDSLWFTWEPLSAEITLSDLTAVSPTFVAPDVAEATTYEVRLVVSDGIVSSDPDTVSISVFPPGNVTPVADAGPDQIVNEQTEVTLDASASSDTDEDALTYTWTAPEGITLSDINAAMPTFTAPNVAADTDYVFSLIVNDGTEDSQADQVVITVKDLNTQPKANAGPDQAVDELTLVTLDGSGSTDDDGDELTFLWTAPEGITLSDATAASPTFTAPSVTSNTAYDFSLVVSDGVLTSAEDNVRIIVINANKPEANAGADQIVNELTTVTLDGSASVNAATYFWTAPEGITLSDVASANPTFTAPEVDSESDLTFSLVVGNGLSFSASDQVVITVRNTTAVETNLSMPVSVYPNPSNGSFKFISPGDGSLVINDIVGKQILNTHIVEGENSIQLLNKNGGLYFLSIDVDGKVSTARIVVDE